MNNILVTGGAGFIGSNLALELQKENEVTILDNFFSGYNENLKEFKGDFLEGDILRYETPKGFDIVFHLASITDPRYEGNNVLSSNIRGFQKVLEYCKKNNSKLIYASSAGVYGNGPVPMKESQEKNPLTDYAHSKLKIDEIALGNIEDMHIVGLRYFNVFGPREEKKGRAASMIYHLANQIVDEKNPRLFENGEHRRDHIYVKDVVDATIKAVNSPSGIYNVGAGVSTTFNELVRIINKVLERNAKIEYFYPAEFNPPINMATYQNNTQANTSLAEKNLGFKAKFNLEQGIRDYFKYLRIKN